MQVSTGQQQKQQTSEARPQDLPKLKLHSEDAGAAKDLEPKSTTLRRVIMTTKQVQEQDMVAIDDLEALLLEVQNESAADISDEIVEATEVEAVEATEVIETVEPVIESPTPKTKKAKKPKAEKAPKVAKAPKEPKPAKAPKVAKAPKEPKPAKEPRICYGSNKVARIAANVSSDFLVLTESDAELEGDELIAAQDVTREIIKAMGSKVKNRATNLLEFVCGKGARLNNISTVALGLLSAEGKIVTGDKGNLHAALLAKPYSPNAARAMGNNTVAMFRLLKIVTKTETGLYVPNADSLLLSVLAGKLSLGFPVADEVTAEVATVE